MTFSGHCYRSALRYAKPSTGNTQLNAQKLSLTRQLCSLFTVQEDFNLGQEREKKDFSCNEMLSKRQDRVCLLIYLHVSSKKTLKLFPWLQSSSHVFIKFFSLLVENWKKTNMPTWLGTFLGFWESCFAAIFYSPVSPAGKNTLHSRLENYIPQRKIYYSSCSLQPLEWKLHEVIQRYRTKISLQKGMTHTAASEQGLSLCLGQNFAKVRTPHQHHSLLLLKYVMVAKCVLICSGLHLCFKT